MTLMHAKVRKPGELEQCVLRRCKVNCVSI